MTIASSRDPIASYRPGQGVDELIGRDGVIRTHWNDLARAYVGLGITELQRRREEVALLLERDGVTYNVTSDDQRHRAWELDPIPLVVPNDDWKHLEYGVRQRAHILDAAMQDLYGERRLLTSGVIPPVMVFDDPAFLRAADGITLPLSKQLVISAADLTRTGGEWTALSNRTQAPSGAGYAIQNRNVISRVFPTIFRNAEALRLAPFVRTLRTTLQAAAPPHVEDPTIVVLTPGPLAETAFEHAFMATQLGYPLVEGSDLVDRDGRIWLRTVSELVPVDVILRRVDAWFCDPLELLPESTLGVPGLVDAARTGAVSIVNPLGSGLMENTGIDTLLPMLSRHLLGEDLALPSVESWWCGEAAGLSHVLANLGSIIVRPLSRRRARGTAIDTRLLSAKKRAQLARRIETHPERWTGQVWAEPSTAPVLTPTGLEPSPTVLRTFAVLEDDDYLVMTGGLARTSATSGPITNQLGALAKDTWVLSTEPETVGGFWLTGVGAPTAEPIAPLPSRAAENMFWLGRYSERAEAAVRLLRVASTRRTEFEHAGSGPGVEAVAALLESVTRVTTTYPGFVGDDAVAKLGDPSNELFSLVVDVDRPGTVAHATDKMFSAVEVLRDQLSVDTWLVIGSMQRSLDRLGRITNARDDAVDTVLSGLLESLLALSGLMAESMVRDHAWQFLEAGRRLERALQVTSLVAALLTTERDPATESIVAESALMAAESIITYRRRYRSHARVATLLDLLLLDPGNPRSLRYQLDRLVDAVGALDAARRDESASIAAALAFEVSTVLDNIDTTALAETIEGTHRVGLARSLDEIRELLLRMGNAIGADNFTRLLPQHAVITPAEPPGWIS